jgi:putative pyruvate formate lyase activating enzyme
MQVGDLVFSPDGLAKRGLLLRHLVMPGLLDEGKAILDWVVQELGRWVSNAAFSPSGEQPLQP